MRRGLLALLALLGVNALLDIVLAERGDKLYVEQTGEGGPTLVFLAGLGGTTRYWRDRVLPLARTCRLVLVDLLGFGRSPKPWTTYTMERHIAELRAVLPTQRRLTLVGHSIGARVAVAYAALYPEQVDRLILINLPFFGGQDAAKRFFRERSAGEGWFLTHMVPAALACLLSRRLFWWLLPQAAPSMPPPVVEDLSRMTWRSSTSTMWELIYRFDLAAASAQIPARIPMLCLHGDQDETAPLEPMRALAATHPNCTIRVLPGGDHHLPIKHPEWVVGQIRQALSR